MIYHKTFTELAFHKRFIFYSSNSCMMLEVTSDIFVIFKFQHTTKGNNYKIFISFTDMTEVKQSIQKTQPPPMSNGFGKVDPMSSGLRAAAVHGQLISQDNDSMVRKPTRLEALQPIGGRKGKKKRNELEPL